MAAARATPSARRSGTTNRRVHASLVSLGSVERVEGGATGGAPVLHARWLGRVAYRDAWALQRALGPPRARLGALDEDQLLLLEHDAVLTLGRHADARAT